MQSQSLISTTSRNGAGFSGHKLIWDGLTQSGKACCGLTSPHFKLFLEIKDDVSSVLKRKRTIQIVISAKSKSQHLWWYGGVLVAMAWATCTYVKAPLMLNGTYRCWSIICYHPGDDFFRDVPAYFSKTMPNRIQHVLQQRGLVVKGCGYLTGLPAVQTCLPLRMCGALWSEKYDNGDPGLLSNWSHTSSTNGKEFRFQSFNS